jgi:hypothetical protein
VQRHSETIFFLLIKCRHTVLLQFLPLSFKFSRDCHSINYAFARFSFVPLSPQHGQVRHSVVLIHGTTFVFFARHLWLSLFFVTGHPHSQTGALIIRRQSVASHFLQNTRLSVVESTSSLFSSDSHSVCVSLLFTTTVWINTPGWSKTGL